MRDFEKQMREIVTRAFNAGYDDDQEGVMDIDVDAVDLLRKAVAAERERIMKSVEDARSLVQTNALHFDDGTYEVGGDIVELAFDSIFSPKITEEDNDD